MTFILFLGVCRRSLLFVLTVSTNAQSSRFNFNIYDRNLLSNLPNLPNSIDNNRQHPPHHSDTLTPSLESCTLFSLQDHSNSYPVSISWTTTISAGWTLDADLCFVVVISGYNDRSRAGKLLSPVKILNDGVLTCIYAERTLCIRYNNSRDPTESDVRLDVTPQ